MSGLRSSSIPDQNFTELASSATATNTHAAIVNALEMMTTHAGAAFTYVDKYVNKHKLSRDRSNIDSLTFHHAVRLQQIIQTGDTNEFRTSKMTGTQLVMSTNANREKAKLHVSFLDTLYQTLRKDQDHLQNEIFGKPGALANEMVKKTDPDSQLAAFTQLANKLDKVDGSDNVAVAGASDSLCSIESYRYLSMVLPLILQRSLWAHVLNWRWMKRYSSSCPVN